MACLHSLGQDDQNEVQHDFFGQVTALVLVSALHDANRTVNGTTTSLRSRQLNEVQHICSCYTTGADIGVI